MKKSKIAITMGDPCGIGPEIIIKAINSLNLDPDSFILIGNKNIFYKTAIELNLPLNKDISIIDIPGDISKMKYGVPDIENGKVSFLSLKEACSLANNGIVESIVTAPLSKQAINMAGYNYSGQTEVLQDFLSYDSEIKSNAEMLFISNALRVLILTRHISLGSIASSLGIDKIIDSIQSLNKSLRNDFNISSPQIAICGLNPHAGESGLIGREEEDIIIPAIKELRETGIKIEGPFPADTIWIQAAKKYFNNQELPYDAYVACYHDQGLIPIKLMAMDSTVNATINLPKIRTSPSHGTAYDIAGKNIANYDSMIKAIKVAIQISDIKKQAICI